MLQAMLRACSKQCSPCICNGRTDGRTEMHGCSEHKYCSYVTRARIDQIRKF